MKKTSAAQVMAKTWSEADRFKPRSPYAAPPADIPRSATARISPNENVEPPRSEPSIRYQTSSIRKNANPTSPAAVNTNTGLVGWRDSVAFDWRVDLEM